MRDISLKWLIFGFYLVFGYLPVLVISYYSASDYSRSVETITEDQLSQLVNQIADQTQMFCYLTRKDLDLLSDFPYVQMSFWPSPYGRNVPNIVERLETFRKNTTALDKIILYTNQGRPLLSTPSDGLPLEIPPDRWAELTRPGQSDYFTVEHLEGPFKRITIFRPVNDFNDPSQRVGFVAGEVALDRVVSFLSRVNIGDGIEKSILNVNGEPLFIQKALNPPNQTLLERIREYGAPVPLLRWKIVVRVPESVLFRDVNRLVFRTLIFTALVALIAAGAAFEFSRRATKPLRTIIDGAAQFAAGNLDYRIDVRVGSETKRLAKAFNTMAARLSERQAELVQANKLASLGLLSAGVAHEIKNPLAGIKTSAQVLNRLAAAGGSPTIVSEGEDGVVWMKRGDVENIQYLARGIVQEVDRLNNIVGDMLNLAKPKSSRIEAVNIAEVTERSIQLVQNQLRRKNVSIDHRVASTTVHVDPNQLLQVFINLILNSLAAVEADRGLITLTSSVNESEELTVSLTDNGCGIPEEKLDQIFDPFFSLSKKGTGLGLSVAYTLLTQNHIHVQVRSREGEGTTFVLTFKGRKTSPQEMIGA